jgi:hypothetical protein
MRRERVRETKNREANITIGKMPFFQMMMLSIKEKDLSSFSSLVLINKLTALTK